MANLDAKVTNLDDNFKDYFKSNTNNTQDKYINYIVSLQNLFSKLNTQSGGKKIAKLRQGHIFRLASIVYLLITSIQIALVFDSPIFLKFKYNFM